MSDLNKIVHDLLEESEAINAHFQIWFVLRNKALPEYKHVLEDSDLTRFFIATSSSHFKMTFISLSKIFDNDKRTSSIKSLIKLLEKDGNDLLISKIKSELSEFQGTIDSLKMIRHQTVAHNQISRSEKEVFRNYQLTPQKLMDLISITCGLINEISLSLGYNRTVIRALDLYEISTLATLAKLKNSML